MSIKKSRTGGLFPKEFITLTFYTGIRYLDFTVESHIPVDVERTFQEVIRTNKEKK